MEHGYPQLGEGILLQCLGVGRHGLALIGQSVILAHQRADDEHLMALLHLLADKAVEPRPVFLAQSEGLHCLPSRRQLIDHGHIQIAVDDKSQRPGDRGGGQHQRVWGGALVGQGGALFYAEAMLFIGDHQTQARILHVRRQQGVCTDAQCDIPALQAGQNGAALPGGGGAGEQSARQAEAGEQRGQIFVMLAGQYFRGGHQGRLPAALGGEPHAGGGHHGLAAAHIALAQAVHGPAGGHIAYGVRDSPPLGGGEGKGQGGIEGRHVRRLTGQAGHRLPPLPQQGQTAAQKEQLLKYQTPPRGVQRLLRGGKVDVLVGKPGIAQMVRLPDPVRQHIFRQVAALVQPLAYGLGHHSLCQPRRQGINGHDAAGEQLLPLRLQQGIDHAAAHTAALDLAVEDVCLSRMQDIFAVFLVEEGYIQHAALVHSPYLHQRLSAADTGGGGRLGDHGLAAGVLPLR